MDEVSEARTKRFLAGFAKVGADEWPVQCGLAADPARFPTVSADLAKPGLDAGPRAVCPALALILTFTVTIVHLVPVAPTTRFGGVSALK